MYEKLRMWLHCAKISPENFLANDCNLYLETEIKSYNQIDYRNMKEISLNRKCMKNLEAIP